MAERTIGIDLGGTNIKAAIVDGAGAVHHRTSIETQADGGFDHVFARLVALIADLRAADPPASAVGIGVPGPMSHARGFIFGAPNLPGWVNIPLRDLLQAAVQLPVSLENDANAAAYGEFVAGAGRDVNDMVMLTLGTGIGGGIIAAGRLHRGHFDNAGEIGHVIAVPGGRACPCGQRGCLERYSSATALAERVTEHVRTGEGSSLALAVRAGKEIDANDVAAAARQGDALAARIWDEGCRHLAAACVNLQHLLNPQRIVLSGGLINAGEQLLTPVRDWFDKLTWNVAPDRPQIEFAALGGDAGVIGAAALASGLTTPPA